MSKYLVIVEGIADIIFFRDYFKFLYIDLKVVEEEKTTLTLKSKTLEIVILESGGLTKLKFLKIKIQDDIKDKYKVFVIQDADNEDKDYGGVKSRKQYLYDEKINLGIDFESFLFPNDSDDGDLETLLLQIVQEDKYKQFENCHTGYIDCLEKFLKKKTIKDFRKEKNYIYTYLSLYEGHHVAKERDRIYGEIYWDFSSNALLPLKKFFETHIVYR